MKHLLVCAVAAGISISGCSPSTESSVMTPQSNILQPELAETDFRAKGIIAGPLPEVINALNTGKISSQALVNLYIERIE